MTYTSPQFFTIFAQHASGSCLDKQHVEHGGVVKHMVKAAK
jgi:hypothetical protein